MKNVVLALIIILTIYTLIVAITRADQVLENRLELVEEREDSFTYRDKLNSHVYVVPKNHLWGGVEDGVIPRPLSEL